MEQKGFTFPAAPKYNNRVLIGDWVEENSSYKKQKHVHESVYKTEYIPKKPVIYENESDRNKYKGLGQPANLLLHQNGTHYLDNYATTYDVSYRIIPESYKGKPLTLPRIDYLKNFGSTMNHGLVDYKKDVWCGDTLDPRFTNDSEYKNLYTKPEPDAYKLSKIDGAALRSGKCNLLTWECLPEAEEKRRTRCVPPKRPR